MSGERAARPIRVLIYEPYPMGKIGGNLRTLWYILERVDRSKFTPIIVTPMETDFIRRTRAAGTECILAEPPASLGRYAGRVLGDNLMGRLRNMKDVLRYNLWLVPLIFRRRIDLIYCNSIRAVLCIGLAGRLTLRPVLWYIKGQLNNPLLDRLGFMLADRILFMCEMNRDDRYPRLVKHHWNKIGILRSGIDPAIVEKAKKKDRSALAKELRISSQRTNVIILGQLYPPKGQHLVLERLRAVVAECPELMLYIVGDHVLAEHSPYKGLLDRIIEREGLGDHVTFTGWRTDALEILSLMDIVLHPSLAEGFPRAVLEAMALGKPVVASSVGGLREIVRDGVNGLLVEPGNSAMIADRLLRLVRDRALGAQLGREARRVVHAEYLIDDKIARLEEIWTAMAAARRRASAPVAPPTAA